MKPLPPPDPREEKLPRWVRAVLQDLRHRHAHLTSEVTALRGEYTVTHADADTFIDGGLGEDIPLGRHTGIRFRLREDSRFNDSVRVRVLEDGGLHIMADRPIHILPAASNTCDVRMEPLT